ncbi:lytic transglycosylase domain-containing protein [Acinetobacter sp. ME22]|uniref:lytic transglycosylase domain-containing protein n=1 Tax=Acinetobacter sp. ME22 TaxID=2904802 RepID=UPI001EDB3CB6|nr:lytic transglycosylase domain-containing protein [Acinetobacter sp. ME22]MCG2574048.1 lytic transglycosylase domain-containing protein [Acinetobacter sp. ME22]
MKKLRVLCATTYQFYGRLFALGCVFGANGAAFAAEEQFNDALRAANSGNTALLDQYTASMQQDALGYYPEYWKLNINLGYQPSGQIVDFARRYPQSAMAEKLAADYVEEKVKQADYNNAQPVVPYVTNPDQAESCAVAQVRAKSGDPLVFAEFKDLWLSTESLPDACQSLGRMMLSSPLMSTQDKQQRLWGQLRAGQLGAALATAQAMGLNLSLAQLNQIQNSPLNYLWSAPKNNATDYAYLIFALSRLTQTDLDSGLSAANRAAENVPEPVQKYLYRSVAYIGGTSVLKNNFNRIVLNYFDASYGDLAFSPEEAEIYARQAVRFGAWDSVMRAIGSMSVTQQQEDRWQYWLARAYEQRGDANSKRIAMGIYQRLAKSGDDYHNLLAQQRLGEAYSKRIQYQPTASDFRRLDQDIHFRRAFALKRINASDIYTNREWNWAVRQAYLREDDGLLLAAAQRAADMGWYDRAIYAANRTINKHNDRLSYLTPHQNTVVSYSQNVGLDPAWAYGLMRQESRFVTHARSSVGAGGLMQIMPETAKQVAKKMGETYNPAVLTDMNTNVRYGTYYLSMIQGQLSDNAVLATAGYNAGPNRARRWQASTGTIAADQYVESIPLSETRDYVKNVMTNATHYGSVLGQGIQNIGKWMRAIPARLEQ